MLQMKRYLIYITQQL